MHKPCRSCWRNCALVADAEIKAIDRMQDELLPLDPGTLKIRRLVSSLELCHHQAGRWVENIIEAIGKGETSKGLGTRSPGRFHPAEAVWRSACAALEAWCEGQPATEIDLRIDTLTASSLLASR